MRRASPAENRSGSGTGAGGGSGSGSDPGAGGGSGGGAGRGSGGPRRRRRLRRWLAPLALASVIAATAVIVGRALSAHGPGHPPARTAITARPLAHYWTVRPGNTLAGISERTGLSIAAIEHDNPRMHGQLIVPGERLDLWSRAGVRTSAQ